MAPGTSLTRLKLVSSNCTTVYSPDLYFLLTLVCLLLPLLATAHLLLNLFWRHLTLRGLETWNRHIFASRQLADGFSGKALSRGWQAEGWADRSDQSPCHPTPSQGQGRAETELVIIRCFKHTAVGKRIWLNTDGNMESAVPGPEKAVWQCSALPWHWDRPLQSRSAYCRGWFPVEATFLFSPTRLPPVAEASLGTRLCLWPSCSSCSERSEHKS